MEPDSYLANRYSARPKRTTTSRPNYKEITDMKHVEVAAQLHNEEDASVSAAKREKLNSAESLIDGLYDDTENFVPNIVLNVKTSPKKKKIPAKKAPAESSKNKCPALKQTSAKKGPAKRKSKLEKINEQLAAIGIEPSEDHGNCARAAIYRGFIKITGHVSDLEQVIVTGVPNDNCTDKFTATLRDLLYQPDYAGMDYENGAQKASVRCDENKKGDDLYCSNGAGRTYVTRICEGKPEFNDGKSHNHCNRCKVFGKCIGDYREAHCRNCGKHYCFEPGPCDCQKSGSDSDGCYYGYGSFL